jgi:hypothetical protein
VVYNRTKSTHTHLHTCIHTYIYIYTYIHMYCGKNIYIFSGVHEANIMLGVVKINFSVILLPTFRHSEWSLYYVFFQKLSFHSVGRSLCCSEHHWINQYSVCVYWIHIELLCKSPNYLQYKHLHANKLGRLPCFYIPATFLISVCSVALVLYSAVVFSAFT